MKIFKIAILAGLGFSLVAGTTSCRKEFLDTKPSDEAVLQDVFKTTEGARRVINGMHRRLYSNSDHDQFGILSINLMYDLMGEDLGMSRWNWFGSAATYNQFRLPAANGVLQWDIYYDIVTNANFILENIDAASGSTEEKNNLKAQAYTYRAWAYFQLIQAYQFPFGSSNNQYVMPNGSARTGQITSGTVDQALGVPIYLAPTKEAKPRATMREVLDQIESDLTAAISNFGTSGSSRSDISQLNVDVAKGIFARYALYMHQWALAATYASEVRNNYQLMVGSALLSGFNSPNSEWVWGFVVNAEQNGIYGSFMSHMDPQTGGYAASAEKIINQYLLGRPTSVDPTLVPIPDSDFRKRWWIPSTGPKPAGFEDYTRRSQVKFFAKEKGSFIADYPMMRSSEMYLIEAEAKAQQNDLAGARTILTEYVRSRDPQYGRADSMLTKDALVHEIWRQRRIELWGEGFRFFDAKRQMAIFSGVTSLDKIDRTPSGFNTSTLGNNATVPFPSPNLVSRIPGNELENNPGCIQNP